MKISVRSLLPGMALGALLFTSTLAQAGPIKTYQVTGPVLEVTDTTITVEKDKEKWQIAREKDTKVTGDLKPGARVTIQYRMTATTVDVKADSKADGKAVGKTDGKTESKTDGKAAKDKPAKK